MVSWYIIVYDRNIFDYRYIMSNVDVIIVQSPLGNRYIN